MKKYIYQISRVEDGVHLPLDLLLLLNLLLLHLLLVLIALPVFLPVVLLLFLVHLQIGNFL